MGDEKMKVEIGGKTYILEEIPFGKFKQAVKAVTKPDGRIDSMDLLTKLISLSLVEPKLKDVEVEELPTSISMALIQAVTQLYNLGGDFLQTSTTTK